MHRAFASSNNQRERERDDGQTCVEQIKRSGVRASAIFPSFSKGVGKPFRRTFDSTHPPLLFHFDKDAEGDAPKKELRAIETLQPRSISSSVSEYALQSRHRRILFVVTFTFFPAAITLLVFLWDRSVCVSLLFFFRRGSERKSVPFGRPFPSRSVEGNEGEFLPARM